MSAFEFHLDGLGSVSPALRLAWGTFLLRASVLECGSPLPLSATGRASENAGRWSPPQAPTQAPEDWRTPKPRGVRIGA